MNVSRGSALGFRLGLELNNVSTPYAQGVADASGRWAQSGQHSVWLFAVGDIGATPTPAAGNLMADHMCSANLEGMVVTGDVLLADGDFVDPSSPSMPWNRLPAVAISQRIPGIPSVAPDNAAGTRAILAHLIAVHGCRQIAHVTGREVSADARERQQAWRSTLATYGLETGPHLIAQGNFGRLSGTEATESLFGRRGLCPDAVFYANDEMAFGGMAAFRAMGFAPGELPAIVGYDNHGSAGHGAYDLTTVDQDIETQVRIAFDLLVGMLRGHEPPASTMVPGHVMTRSSCGCPRSEVPVDEAIALLSEREGLTLRLASIVQQLSGARDANALFASLDETLELLGVTDFWIVTYDRVVSAAVASPGRVTRVSSKLVYDLKARQRGSTAPVSVEAGNLLPPGVADGAGHLNIVLPLSHGQKLIGHVVLRARGQWLYVFDLLVLQLAAALDCIGLIEQLHSLSRHDELTGMANRRGFVETANRNLAIAHRTAVGGAVFYMDLDDMKLINDTFGHSEGDAAIVAAARVLEGAVRETDALGRVGGDEFVMVTMGGSEHEAARLEERIREAVSEFNRSSGKPWQLSISIGVKVYRPSTRSSLMRLMEAADKALYAVKRERKATRLRTATAARNQAEGRV